MSKLNYLIYRIDNIVNGKYYIGAHETNNIYDSYMGSGKYISSAIAKHGVDSFSKSILFHAYDFNSMYYAESLLVTQKEVDDPMCYNLIPGGRAPPNHSGSSIYNNGISEKRVYPNDEVPLGWELGRMQDVIDMATASRNLRYSTMTDDELKLMFGSNVGKRRYYNPFDHEDRIISPIDVDGYELGLPKSITVIPAYDPISGDRGKFKTAEDIPFGWIRGNNWESPTTKGLQHYHDGKGNQAFYSTEDEAKIGGHPFKGNIAVSLALSGTNVWFNPATGETKYIRDLDSIDVNWMPGRPHKKHKTFICYRLSNPDIFHVFMVGSDESKCVNRINWAIGIPDKLKLIFGKYVFNPEQGHIYKKATHTQDYVSPPGTIFVSTNDISLNVCKMKDINELL